MKMHKKQIVRIISSFLVGFLLCIQFGACAAKPSVELEEQLKLGMRYLSELDYENAVIAFSAAIEIDSKNARAYAGMYAAYIACSKIEKADEVWTTMLAKGVSADDVYGWVGRMADTISQSGDDGGKVQEATALKVLSDTASKNDSKAANELVPALCEEQQEEVYTGDIVLGSEEYEQLEVFLYQFCDGYYGTYDCKNLILESTGEWWKSHVLLERMLSPQPCYIDSLYPGENSVELIGYEHEDDWIQDPLGKLGKYGRYTYSSSEKVEWVMKNIFNCSQEAIDAMEASILNGEDDERYLYEGRFYSESNYVSELASYLSIENIQQVGRYYLVKYTIRREDNNRIMSEHSALLKLKKIDGSLYWSLYYNQEGFLLDEASWPYQEMP